MRWCGSCFGMPQLLKCKNTEILHWFKEKFLPVRYNKKEDDNRHPLLSGYCDSNTGPSGPKPDALANCATPRFPIGTANVLKFYVIANFLSNFLQEIYINHFLTSSP